MVEQSWVFDELQRDLALIAAGLIALGVFVVGTAVIVTRSIRRGG